MVYQVPPSKASIKQNRFEFTVPGSKKVHSVPKVQYVKPAFLAELQRIADGAGEGDTLTQGQQVALYQAQMRLFEHYVPGFADLFDDSEQIGELMAAWQAESNISLGESSASAGS